MLEAMKKDEGLDTAIKSMAESAALLTKTLASGMQFMFSGMQPTAGHVPSQPSFNSNPFGFPPTPHQTSRMNAGENFASHDLAQSSSNHSAYQGQTDEGLSAGFQFINYGRH